MKTKIKVSLVDRVHTSVSRQSEFRERFNETTFPRWK